MGLSAVGPFSGQIDEGRHVVIVNLDVGIENYFFSRNPKTGELELTLVDF